MNKDLGDILRKLPSVDVVLRDQKLSTLLEGHPRAVVVSAVREALARQRRKLVAGDLDMTAGTYDFQGAVVEDTVQAVKLAGRPYLRPVINATGVVLHTNLGRSLLGSKACNAVAMVASGYSNLELNLDTGQRGSRYMPLEPLLSLLTGAASALVVNNNAAAVLLALSTMARGREVIVSRGQLVEIGGSFRIPEVMAQSGAVLVEVGTTNKTYPEDYRRAINQNTALLLNVHTSNYRIVGFARETTIGELVEVGRQFSLPVLCDLGSGSLIDFNKYGLPGEPVVKEIVSAGPDVVTFSGDKLLGGPQAGIIVGSRQYVDQMKKNPLARAVRIDKMTAAALEATLREYLDEDGAVENLPTLRMLAATPVLLENKAHKLAGYMSEALGDKATVEVCTGESAVGGGAMPTVHLPTYVVNLHTQSSASELQAVLRRGDPSVIARVQEDRLLFDVRTIGEEQFKVLSNAVVEAIDAGERLG